MFRIESNEIYITKGDSGSVELSLYDADGLPYDLQAGDAILLEVKDASGTAKITKNAVPLDLTPTDTASMNPGEQYSYRLKVTLADGSVHTVIQDERFHVL